MKTILSWMFLKTGLYRVSNELFCRWRLLKTVLLKYTVSTLLTFEQKHVAVACLRTCESHLIGLRVTQTLKKCYSISDPLF